MRKLHVVALASVLTLGAVAAFAQTTPSTSMDKPATSATATKTTTTATKTTTAKKATASHATGKITAMDATAKTVTVKDTYNTSDDTKFMAKGKAITMGDLHVGDTVAVTYWKDGMKASKVTVTHAAKM
jgi:sRNA-binding protein